MMTFFLFQLNNKVADIFHFGGKRFIQFLNFGLNKELKLIYRNKSSNENKF